MWLGLGGLARLRQLFERTMLVRNNVGGGQEKEENQENIGSER